MSKLKFSDGLIIFLIVINILPVLAPILQNAGFIFPAKVIYFIYSFFCHQIHWRSLHIYDHQCAWCARDMAIWGAFLATAVLVRIYQLKGFKWYQIVPFAIPIALDGGIQTIATGLGIGNGQPIYVSTNLMRMVTGSIFGIGMGAVMLPLITSLELGQLQDRVRLFAGKFSFNQLLLYPLIFVFMVFSYVGFVGIWDLTSSGYEPSNAFDSEVKLPEDQDLWLERRHNGTCPTTIALKSGEATDPFALECFF